MALVLSSPLPSLTSLQTMLGILVAVVSLAGAIAGSKLLMLFWVPKIRLALDLETACTERDEARSWAERLEGRLAMQAVDITSVLELVGELRREVGETRAEALATRKTLVVAFRHIADLVTHIKARKSADLIPMLPPEISDEVLAELRAREHAAAVDSLAAAVAAAPGGAP
jgi:hypothetical protein